jgi:hypothetical protein
VLLCACGGGGGTANTPAVSAVAPAANAKPTAGPAGFAPVSFSIMLPSKSASATVRTPSFVPASTTAVTVSVNSTTPASFPCSGSTCTGTFQAPAGASDNFTFTAVDGESQALSESTFSQTIAANGVNTLNVTLEGIVHNVALSTSTTGLSSATSGTVTVTAAAFDIDGDAITGTYFVPLTLGLSGDTTGSLAGNTIASSTATGTITYTPAAATIYAENRVLITQTASTETTAQSSVPLEVGRTLYTWTSANTVVGFAPGSTTPTRSIAIPGTLNNPSSITCDGTNLYLADSEVGALYAISPTATTAVQYTSDSSGGPVWVAANGGTLPNNQAQFFAANINPAPLSEYVGAGSSPPFPLPPDSIAAQPMGDGNGSQSAVMDKSGNIYTALANPDTYAGGYEVFNNSLTLQHSVTDTGVAYGSDMIAIDQTTTPPRIYTEERNANYDAEVAEYDNFATTPTYVSSDSADLGIFVDPLGNTYTSAYDSIPGSVARRAAPQSRVRTKGRRRTEAGFAIWFDVRSSGSFNGTSPYLINGNSLAFDSEGYVYANQYSGSIQEYAPASPNLVTTYTGTTYGIPNNGPYQFATFCR